jgi:hypothetical protein
MKIIAALPFESFSGSIVQTVAVAPAMKLCRNVIPSGQSVESSESHTV